ncbi:hypothetical protein L195_g062296, partial [Trifolium pratense]
MQPLIPTNRQDVVSEVGAVTPPSYPRDKFIQYLLVV